ncbi:MAG: HNH endonuclease [Thioalkalivibrio sp.]|nr:HNH endonuclease [Thioalkalivibrio sp.]
MKAFVGVTDWNWFRQLRHDAPDDVNFWRPSGKAFRALQPGDPFLFKLHAPRNVIAGGGFFVEARQLPVSQAWMAFERRNGVRDVDELLTRIDHYRRAAAGLGPADPVIGAIVLTQPFFFEDDEFVPAPDDWHPNIVVGKGYDVATGAGARMWQAVLERLRLRGALELPPADADPRTKRAWVEQRLGQGAFRSRVADAYERRCAVTGERTLPVLEAAHIVPHARQGPNQVDNGLLLRSDLHRLFDRGLATVEPEHLTFRVSDRIREEYSNGRVYYELDGTPLKVVPAALELRPSRQFLEVHRSTIYRP